MPCAVVIDIWKDMQRNPRRRREGKPAMNADTSQRQDAPPPNELPIRALYQRLLDAWNARSADAFAHLFAQDGDTIGFDGSQLLGRAAIATELRRIFTDHPTAAYKAK